MMDKGRLFFYFIGRRDEMIKTPVTAQVPPKSKK